MAIRTLFEFPSVGKLSLRLRDGANERAALVRQRRPKRVVECGTAIGYSGLWIARELKALGEGKLITIEIDPNRVHEAEENFRRAGYLAQGDRYDRARTFLATANELWDSWHGDEILADAGTGQFLATAAPGAFRHRDAFFDIEARRAATVPLMATSAACGFPSPPDDYLDRPARPVQTSHRLR